MTAPTPEQRPDALPPLGDFISPAAPQGAEYSFWEHLRELRARLIKALLAIFPACLVAYEWSPEILSFLTKPLLRIMPEGQGLIATALPETFLIHLKLSLWSGLFLSSPFWLYQLWAFAAPGLYRKERKAIVRLAAMAFILLVLGAAFAYYTALPIGFKFLVGFGSSEVRILPAIGDYLSLTTTLLLSFGLAFELPLFLMFLASVGLVNSARLARFRPYAIVIIVTVAAFLTPPDVVSQILMSIPMLGLYELSLFLIRSKERAREKALLKSEKEEGGAP